MDECQLTCSGSGKGIDQGPGKELECDHRGNRMSRKSKEVLVPSWSVWRGRPRPRKRHAPEHDRLSRLNQCSGKEKLRLQLAENLLDQVVLSHRNAARDQQQVGFK